MIYLEVLKQSADSLLSHKLRSFLTLLGIVISIASVVVVSSVIEGFNRYFEEKLDNLGTRLVYINRYADSDFSDFDEFAKAERRNDILNERDYEYIRERTSLFEDIGVKTPGISPLIKTDTTNVEDISVVGASANINELENLKIEEGRFFSEIDNEEGRRVVFIGRDLANEFGGGESPVGKNIKIGGMPYQIIGVAVARGSFWGQSQDSFAVLPLKAFKKDFGDVILTQGLTILGKSRADVLQDEAVDEIRFWMRQRRGLAAGEKDTFGIKTMNDVIAARDRIAAGIFFAALALPSIILFVGSTIVLNVMMVSVVERTKEIGIRKAIGATKKVIVFQFLMEAVILCLIGGFFGILVAGLINMLVSNLLFSVSLSAFVICIAIFTSTLVGILSGIFPALKAASMPPTAALNAD